MNDRLAVTLEKKQWIRTTPLCNNACTFCLDANKHVHKPIAAASVLKKIREGRTQGAVRLVLSGGDPTVNTHLEEFIRYGKQCGYNKIQIITNGRKLSYRPYLQALVHAGLQEVTFSIHGDTARMHDGYTRVPGSFVQSITGIKNALALGLIVNIDTVITKTNYRFIPRIIKFFYSLGIRECNLMSLVPVGNALTFQKELFYDFKKVAPYVHKAIAFARAHGMVFWLSRFPPRYLEGFEEYIDPTGKLKGDTNNFNHSFPCRGKACEYCSLRGVCAALQRYRAVRKKPSGQLLTVRNSDDVTIAEVKPGTTIKLNIEDVRAIPRMTDLVKAILSKRSNVLFENIPPCRLPDPTLYAPHDRFQSTNKDDLLQEVVQYVLIKPEKCDRCAMNARCRGIPQNYVVAHGFKEFRPLRGKRK